MRTPLLLLLSAILACDPKVQSYAAEGTLYRGATYDERLDNAIAGTGERKISFEANDALGKRLAGARKAVYADAPAKLAGLPEGTTATALLADKAVREALLGRDEAAAARLLREKGVGVVVLHYGVAASLDMDQRVLSRMYNHDFLQYFSLFRVGEGLLYYEIREEPPAFPPQVAFACIEYIKHRLGGGAPMVFPDVKVPEGQWDLMAVARAQGQELAVGFSRHKTLPGALEEVVQDLERIHRRDVELLGFPPIRRHIKEDLTIELHRVTERAYVEPRDEATLAQLWELGVDGAFMLRELGEGADKRTERAVMPGAMSYTRSLRSVDSFLRETAEAGKMSENRPWKGDGAWLEMIRTIHFRQERPQPGAPDGQTPPEEPAKPGQLAQLVRGVPVIPTERVTTKAVRDGIVAAGEWYLANLQPNGQVTYKYWPSENRYSSEYNHVRHALATWNLVQAYNLDPRPEFLEGAKRALQFTDQSLKREDVQAACAKAEWCDPKRLDVQGQMAFYDFANNRKLGSVVVNLLGMVDLARATGSHEWDEQMREMGRFVKFSQKADGTFQGYYVPKDHPYYTFQNDIVPGEAALSLLYLAEYFDDDSWINGLPAYWAYYQPWFREKVVKKDPEAPWPKHTYHNETRLDLVEFGPWTIMAANAYHRRTGDAEVAKFGLEIARWIIETYQWSEERSPWPDYIGGYYKLPDELPSMQTFCYAEGTAAAYQLALRYAPDQAPFFEKATRQTMRFALEMQYNGFSVYPFSRPEEVWGGIRYTMNETKVRIDYVYHAQSAMYQWYMAAKDDASLPAAVREGEGLPGQLRPPEMHSWLRPADPSTLGRPPLISGASSDSEEDVEGGE